MKKYLILIVSLLMFATINQGQSQVPHCDGDPCVNASACGSWVQATDLSIALDPNCPSCIMTIRYKYRDNSGCSFTCPSAPPFEFQIDYVVTDGSCFYSCNGNPAQYSFSQMDKLYMVGVFQVLRKHSLPFITIPPNPPLGCGPVIPNFKGTSCKKQYIAPDGNVYILTCFLTECCVQNLQFCVDINGKETMTKANIYSPPDNCGTDPDGLSCTYSCDWEWEESLVPKEVKALPNNIYDNYKVDYTIDPSNLNIKLEGELNGKLSLNIFSTEGISNIYEVLNVNETSFEINLDNNFTNGAYYMAFSINGELIKIESFMIVK